MNKIFIFHFPTLLIWLTVAGCGKEDTAVDCSQANLNFTVNITHSSCGTAQGSIVVTPAAGAQMIRYKLNEGSFTNSGMFGSLNPGEYTIMVENAEGCSRTEKVLIRSGISFEESVQPIIAKSCAIDSCHDGIGNLDYRIFSNFNPPEMKARTQSGNMPKEGTLTPDEIDAIACWVDDGALNN